MVRHRSHGTAIVNNDPVGKRTVVDIRAGADCKKRDTDQLIMEYSKQAPFVTTVGILIVNDVPATLADRIGAVPNVIAVLHVCDNSVPSAVLGVMNTLLLAVTAVVLIVQVPAEAATSQKTAPADAAPQDTTEGFAAVPDAAQLAAGTLLCVVTHFACPVALDVNMERRLAVLPGGTVNDARPLIVSAAYLKVTVPVSAAGP